jgi:diguanylate cyclase (GGDEF)-like protein
MDEIVTARVAAGTSPAGDSEMYRAEVRRLTRLTEPVYKVWELGDGRVILVSSRPMPDGGWVATHQDITEQRRAEAKISHMARHDALTDLPNRLYFHERLDSQLRRVTKAAPMAVLSLDLDDFKAVNDAHGHPFGDRLLTTVADRLRRCVRDTDVVARLGGDEFIVLQGRAGQPFGATMLAQRLIDALSAHYQIDGHEVVVGTSVGIAIAPHDGIDPDQLIRNADMALYRAKSEGRGIYRFFEPEMDAQMRARRALEVDLRQALSAGQFELYYQPIIDLETGAISAVEALIRWNHPQRGLVSPADFISLAEDIGLITPIGEWVIRRACDDAAGWPDEIAVAVNLSPVQFRSKSSLLNVVTSALASSGLPATRLVLEITETVLMQDNEFTLSILHQLRSLGIRICMDDFGTGYSSLGYLRRFPFDKIKIDRSFIKDFPERRDSVSIVRAVTGLGASLGIPTTAEGVENVEQIDMLRANGCTEAQGFHYSPPRPVAELPRLFARLRSSAHRAVA